MYLASVSSNPSTVKKKNTPDFITHHSLAASHTVGCGLLPWLTTGRTGNCADATVQLPESESPHVSGPGKDPDSKFKVQALLNANHFCTMIKLKNHKENHHKPEIICIIFYRWMINISPPSIISGIYPFQYNLLSDFF
jgi:hypothetical protein